MTGKIKECRNCGDFFEGAECRCEFCCDCLAFASREIERVEELLKNKQETSLMARLVVLLFIIGSVGVILATMVGGVAILVSALAMCLAAIFLGPWAKNE